jgi:hypothetical protein
MKKEAKVRDIMVFHRNNITNIWKNKWIKLTPVPHIFAVRVWSKNIYHLRHHQPITAGALFMDYT